MSEEAVLRTFSIIPKGKKKNDEEQNRQDFRLRFSARDQQLLRLPNKHRQHRTTYIHPYQKEDKDLFFTSILSP